MSMIRCIFTFAVGSAVALGTTMTALADSASTPGIDAASATHTPARRPAPPESLDARRRAVLDQILLHLNAGEKNTGMIPTVYTESAVFVDPTFPEGLQGQDALLRYHTALNAMIETFVVDIEDVIAKGNVYVVLWKATATLGVKVDLGTALKNAGLPTLGHKLEIKPIRLGPIHYDGATTFEFPEGEARVAVHKDYYDGSVMYEQIPVLKQLLGLVKSQMAKSLTQPANH